eukprot:6357761-Amphidinium_carterae.1
MNGRKKLCRLEVSIKYGMRTGLSFLVGSRGCKGWFDVAKASRLAIIGQPQCRVPYKTREEHRIYSAKSGIDAAQ